MKTVKNCNKQNDTLPRSKSKAPSLFAQHHEKKHHIQSLQKFSFAQQTLFVVLCLTLCAIPINYVYYSRQSTCQGCGQRIPSLSMTTNKEKSVKRNKVFTGLKSSKAPSPKKEAMRLKAFVSSQDWESVQMDIEGQRLSLLQNGDKCQPTGTTTSTNNDVLSMFDELIASPRSEHLAQELWKYCMLFIELNSDHETDSNHAVAYLDIDSPILYTFKNIFDPLRSQGVIADERFYNKQAIHGSLLVLHRDKGHGIVAQKMIEVILQTGKERLTMQPELIPTTLFTFIDESLTEGWNLFQQRCHFEPREGLDTELEKKTIYPYRRDMYACPSDTDYCCDIISPDGWNELHDAVMVTRSAMLPYRIPPLDSELKMPFGIWKATSSDASLTQDKSSFDDPLLQDEFVEDLPYITKIRDEETGISKEVSKNAFDLLWKPECARPFYFKRCKKCLKETEGNCEICKQSCPCFCSDDFCKVDVPEKKITKILHYYPPEYRRDLNRLIPRIIHQTYFEPITDVKYPNFSRLVESWKQDGWEYRFYSDKDARDFLVAHYPPEVLHAFDSLLPGAFKADLFRYCILFTYGGIYADIDVLAEAKLDKAIDHNVGFLVPFDSPTTREGNHACLWNGLLGAAPGHPFLAQAIQTVVNNVRNRFTSIDVMNSFCPEHDVFLMNKFDLLFTAGPCILGSSVNKVLERSWSSTFDTTTIPSPEFLEKETRSDIPGRTIILKQNKNEMGAHRFILEEKNLIFAGTDFPNYDDRKTHTSDGSDTAEQVHYSKSAKGHTLYGVNNLYHDKQIANERIIFEPSLESI